MNPISIESPDTAPYLDASPLFEAAVTLFRCEDPTEADFARWHAQREHWRERLLAAPAPCLQRLAPPAFSPLEQAVFALCASVGLHGLAAHWLEALAAPHFSLTLAMRLLSNSQQEADAATGELLTGALIRRRVLQLAETGNPASPLRLSPQLRLALLHPAPPPHDFNRVLHRLQRPAHPLLPPETATPDLAGWQVVGLPGSGRRSAVLAAAGERPVYQLDAVRLWQFDDPYDLLADLLTFVDLHDAYLLWPDEDQLVGQPIFCAHLQQWLQGNPRRRLVRLSSQPALAPAFLAAEYTPGLASPAHAAALWRNFGSHYLGSAGVTEGLASRYPLQPADMLTVIHATKTLSGPLDQRLQLACQQREPAQLAGLARRILPKVPLDQVELEAAETTALQELMGRYRHRDLLQAEGLSRQRGVAALFWGRPGTGKTMAAEAIACELGLPLYQVNLAGVSSKWIGETEKHLERLFDEAERYPCVLFFDEADAVFGRRSEVKDSHDRHANLGVSYLLQRVEASNALVILASNFKQNLDEAFLRRLSLSIEFNLPDVNRRQRLWQRWQTRLGLDAATLEGLAEQFELSPAQIANVALSTRLASLRHDGSPRREDIAHALGREYEKADQRFYAQARIQRWLEGSSER
ncbi:ATP-binding protein [Parachitinimonas caeni]|uniref:ATP-binding protein n=1 Tax=Parachitinimonas caeni TaxID=3031301 RepID=A0ABT7DZF5_9NEIS|nr:ATP-binding protein [Parachitinimonas caeni]MDK2125450.1 ATP-binding protein [Parachitinimonas caeni]